MGIGVTQRQVKLFEHFVKREMFEDGVEFRRFLQKARLTRGDFRERVELELLVGRIQERVLVGVRGERARNRVLSRFIAEYAERWRARTVCAPEYVMRRCSNASAS